MSWLFSKAMMEAYANSLSSPELVEEYSVGTYLDGEQFAQLNVMPTQHKFWRNDKTMEFSDLSRFGLTLKLLTEEDGEELLTLYLAAFPVKTSVQQDEAKVLVGHGLDYGNTWPELSVKYDLLSFSWKTALCLLNEDLPWSLVTLPKWGMTRNGRVFQHPKLERPISVTAFGLLPTVTARDYRSEKCTPEIKAKRDAHPRGKTLPWVLGGLLNPEFAEYMMGWPLGWTELKPLATGKFQLWLQQHGKF